MASAGNASLLLALCLTFGVAGNAVSQPSQGDAFDVSRGAIVTSTSGVRSGSVIEDIFGAEMSIIEPGVALFSDAGAANSIHVVEWTTPAPVAISVINVFAQHDLLVNNKYARSFDRFVLMAHNVDGDFELLDVRLPVPYPSVDLSVIPLISEHVPAVLADRFTATFEQHETCTFCGPRVDEIDGYIAGGCGDANVNGSIQATDALIALKSAVGTDACPTCMCDVDLSGTVAASDALGILRDAVGSGGPLTCSLCEAERCDNRDVPTCGGYCSNGGKCKVRSGECLFGSGFCQSDDDCSSADVCIGGGCGCDFPPLPDLPCGETTAPTCDGVCEFPQVCRETTNGCTCRLIIIPPAGR